MLFEDGWWQVVLVQLPPRLSVGASAQGQGDDDELIEVYCGNFGQAQRVPLTSLRPRWKFDADELEWTCTHRAGEPYQVQLPRPARAATGPAVAAPPADGMGLADAVMAEAPLAEGAVVAPASADSLFGGIGLGGVGEGIVSLIKQQSYAAAQAAAGGAADAADVGMLESVETEATQTTQPTLPSPEEVAMVPPSASVEGGDAAAAAGGEVALSNEPAVAAAVALPTPPPHATAPALAPRPPPHLPSVHERRDQSSPRHDDLAPPVAPSLDGAQVVPGCTEEECGRYTDVAFEEGMRLEYTPEASASTSSWYEVVVVSRARPNSTKVQVQFLALTAPSDPGRPIVEWVGRLQLRPRPPPPPPEWFVWLQTEDMIDVFDAKGWSECTMLEALPPPAPGQSSSGSGATAKPTDPADPAEPAEPVGAAPVPPRLYRIRRTRDEAELVVPLADLRPRFKWKLRRVKEDFLGDFVANQQSRKKGRDRKEGAGDKQAAAGAADESMADAVTVEAVAMDGASASSMVHVEAVEVAGAGDLITVVDASPIAAVESIAVAAVASETPITLVAEPAFPLSADIIEGGVPPAAAIVVSASAMEVANDVANAVTNEVDKDVGTEMVANEAVSATAAGGSAVASSAASKAPPSSVPFRNLGEWRFEGPALFKGPYDYTFTPCARQLGACFACRKVRRKCVRDDGMGPCKACRERGIKCMQAEMGSREPKVHLPPVLIDEVICALPSALGAKTKKARHALATTSSVEGMPADLADEVTADSLGIGIGGKLATMNRKSALATAPPSHKGGGGGGGSGSKAAGSGSKAGGSGSGSAKSYVEEAPAPPYFIAVRELQNYLHARAGFILSSKITSVLAVAVKAGRIHREGMRLRSTHLLMAPAAAAASGDGDLAIENRGGAALRDLSADGLGLGLGGGLATAARMAVTHTTAKERAQATRDRHARLHEHRMRCNASVYQAAVAASHRRLRFLVEHQVQAHAHRRARARTCMSTCAVPACYHSRS